MASDPLNKMKLLDKFSSEISFQTVFGIREPSFMQARDGAADGDFPWHCRTRKILAEMPEFVCFCGRCAHRGSYNLVETVNVGMRVHRARVRKYPAESAQR